MKGDLCQKCRVGTVESRAGCYCPPCLQLIKEAGKQTSPNKKGFYWTTYGHNPK